MDRQHVRRCILHHDTPTGGQRRRIWTRKRKCQLCNNDTFFLPFIIFSFFLLLFFSLHQPRSVFPPCSHRLQAPAVHSSVARGLNCITTLRFLTILSPLPLSPSLLHPLRLKAAPKKTAVPSFLEGHRVAARDATYFGFIMLIFYLCDGAQVLNIQQKS